ncbi:MAG TPA: protein kinase [Vicinamibacteria bacterium]|nr:protein kinase [Vicinamibacteria bacterium]
MPLAPGTRLGPYEITAPIGKGGMGEVYRARDTKLNRDVAIKVLPDAFATDADRMKRFEREAQVLASLNHPNIAAIYGLENNALILELVEGLSLAERLGQGPLPLEEAIPIARQVAEELEAAHEKGIIHRDLKPANVMLSGAGDVKILDFGLGKALENEATSDSESSHSPTLTRAATEAGVLLGTASYMSPEQARGKTVDKRADIWAFGCVLFELLSGQKACHGDTIADTLAAVLKDEPDWSRLPATTPSQLQHLLRRLLTKNARDRLRDIGEARIALAATGADEDNETGARPLVSSKAVFALALLAATVVAFGVFRLAPPQPEAPLLKFEIPVDDLETDFGAAPQLSPDGSSVAYVAAGRLWIRRFDELTPREIRDTSGVHEVFWSPDGAWLAYEVNGKLWKSPLTGGEASLVCDIPGQGRILGGVWTTGDDIKMAVWRGGLYRVSARGGSPEVLFDIDPETEVDFHSPSLLSDERSVLVAAHRKDGALRLVVLAEDGNKKVLETPVHSPDVTYAPSGHLLYSGETGVSAMPFSLENLDRIGEPFSLASQGSQPRASANGTLLYVRDTGDAGKNQLTWVDRAGAVVSHVGEPLTGLQHPTLSPDGRAVAAWASVDDNYDIWTFDVARGVSIRMTTDASPQGHPFWSPSGDQILYTDRFRSGEGGSIHSIDSNGAGEKRQWVPDGQNADLSRDGRFIAYVKDERGNKDLWFVPLEGNEALTPLPFVQSPTHESHPVISPEGNYLVRIG